MAFTPSLAAVALYAGLCMALIIVLAVRVVRRRIAGGISLGDGGDPGLAAAIRAHGNAVETIPVALVLLTIAALAGAPSIAIHALGLPLLLGRLSHAWALCAPGAGKAPRVAGMALTFLSQGLAALGLIAHGLGAL